MNTLIEPNVHPVLVHFAVGLLVTAAVVIAVTAFAPAQARWRGSLQSAGDVMLALGLAALASTVAAGFQAWYSVAHDAPSHVAMTTHRNWALATAAVFALLGLWRWSARRKAPSEIFAIVMLVAASLLTTTAWWGGRLVFHHGLGVKNLPEVTGHAHDHGPGGHDHNHAPPAPAPAPAAGSPGAAADAFHDALAAGDEAAVQRLLAQDVLILESGGTERSLEEYAAHHMKADMAFMRDVKAERLSRASGLTGDAAWVATERAVRGRVGDREVVVKAQETLVLRREDGVWRIVHVHWSSSPLPAQAGEKAGGSEGGHDHGEGHEHGDHEHDH